MCTRDSYMVGLSGDFQLIRTCVRVIQMWWDCYVRLDITYMCTNYSEKEGMSGDFRLIGTCLPMIHIRQDYFVTLD